MDRLAATVFLVIAAAVAFAVLKWDARRDAKRERDRLEMRRRFTDHPPFE